MKSIDEKVLDSDEIIKLGLFDSRVLGSLPGNVDVITFGLDFGTELGSLGGPFHVSKDVMFEGLLLVDSLGK